MQRTTRQRVNRSSRSTLGRGGVLLALSLVVGLIVSTLSVPTAAAKVSTPTRYYNLYTKKQCDTLRGDVSRFKLPTRTGKTSTARITIRTSVTGNICAYVEDRDGSTTRERHMEVIVQRVGWKTRGYESSDHLKEYAGAIWHRSPGACRTYRVMVFGRVKMGGHDYRKWYELETRCTP